MKKLLFILILAMAATPAVFAQATTDDDTYNRGEVGVFVDYLRLKHANQNQFGLGARAGFNVHKNVQLEGDFAYDFRASRTNTVVSGATTTTYRSDLRTLSLLFGPKFHTNGPVRVFGVLKGGILNFSVSTTGAPLGFEGTVGNIANGDTNGVFYPAGGIEAFAGWFGFRAEVGDLMYFDRGANHNLRITVGPQFRF